MHTPIRFKKSNKIFLLENYVWISISLTKNKSIKTGKWGGKKPKQMNKNKKTQNKKQWKRTKKEEVKDKS